MNPFTKFKKKAQIAWNGGWNKHVDKRMKRKANKVLRRWLRTDEAP